MMFGLFKPRLMIPDEEFEWMLACCKWFVEQFEGEARFVATPFVCANSEFFPPDKSQGHDRARFLFETTKRLAGLENWACKLEPGLSQRENRVGTGLALQHETSPPAGTFSQTPEMAVITYDPGHIENPQMLIATFAHELAHMLLHSCPVLPPGGSDLEEHATDLCAVFLGFGAFQTNSAKTFSQFQSADEQGWQMKHMGYLSEASLLTATALFALLTGASRKNVEFQLKDYLRKSFRKSIAVIEKRHPNLWSTIHAIDLSEWA